MSRVISVSFAERQQLLSIKYTSGFMDNSFLVLSVNIFFIPGKSFGKESLPPCSIVC